MRDLRCEHDAFREPSAHAPRRNLRRADQPEGIGAEEPAEMLRRDVEDIDEHMRRTGEIGVERRIADRTGQRISDKAAVAQDASIVGKDDRRMQRPVRAAMGFRQADRHRDCDHRADDELKPEDRAPACPEQKISSQERRDERRHAQHQHHIGQHARRFLRPENIADAGARDDAARAGADGLEETRQHQHPDIRRQRTGRTHQHVKHEADIERRLAAESVRHRAEERLPDGEAQKERREGVFCRADGHMQVTRDRRQRRQIHVDGKRTERRQRAEEHDQLDTAAGRKRLLKPDHKGSLSQIKNPR